MQSLVIHGALSVGVIMSQYYRHFLEEQLRLRFDAATCRRLLEQRQLDKELSMVIANEAAVKALRSLLYMLPSELFDSVQSHLSACQEQIVRFYTEWFREHPIMGDSDAYASPDAVVVLGTKAATAEKRVWAAVEYMQRHAPAYLILSGGGFSSLHTESEAMYATLQHLTPAYTGNVLQERDSMDTIGNALFSKLMLKRAIWEGKVKNIVVITSQFHAARALHYFDAVYKSVGVGQGASIRIAALGVQTEDHSQVEALALHELLSEYEATQSLSLFHEAPPHPIDDTAVLIRLFQQHHLYQHRYDILRKYLPYCQEEGKSNI